MTDSITGEYQVKIGLEIHVALATDSKMFCGCSTAFGDPPNANVCPVCLGLPGSLPVLNRQAVELGMTCGLALECEVNPQMLFERKNYHYPDLPKGYQISQLVAPLAEGGQFEFSDEEGQLQTVRIRRVHLEEDAGKLLHDRRQQTLVDFNRCGVPLAEIVTEPDIHSAAETRTFLEELRALLRAVGVSAVRMEEGELRCDTNINVIGGSETEAVRTEITELKNLNSFRGVERAVLWEVNRHIKALQRGDTLTHETRHWDEDAGVTVSARAKEEAHDYRYFPEPDLLAFSLDGEWVDRLAGDMAETPRRKRARLQKQYGVDEYTSRVLVSEDDLGDFFEQAVNAGGNPEEVANWLMGEVQGYLNAEELTLQQLEVTPEQLVAMLKLVDSGEISGKMAKELWPRMAETGRDPGQLVQQMGLQQISDEQRLEELIGQVLDENPDAVVDYAAGKERVVGFLMGQIMQRTQGQANPQLANEKLREALAEEKEVGGGED